MKIEENKIRISVRNLVEFVLRSGNIDNRRSDVKNPEAMQEGSRIHRKIQRSMGSDYEAEVRLLQEFPMERGVLVVEGRADGIITTKDLVTVDEIKGVYQEVLEKTEPDLVHLAQGQMYAYIYALQKNLKKISVQVTYCQLETEEIKRFVCEYTFGEIKEIVQGYLTSYERWVTFLLKHRQERQESLEAFPFPYPYRQGQRDIVVQAYRAMEQGKNLFVQAPTGIGKTLATLYPAVMAVGQGYGEKIFYLTAKTITRKVAEEGMLLFQERGLSASFTTITAKEKLCVLDVMECNPEICPRAKGHFDRVNDAVYDLITHESAVTRQVILDYAEKYQVCPYEMCLDVTYYTDVIICDYNYAFAPHVRLQRFFAESTEKDYLFLIDESHNLVDRGRDMYTASIEKESFLAAKKIYTGQTLIRKHLDACNRIMLELKRECDQVLLYDEEGYPTALLAAMERLFAAMQRFHEKNPGFEPHKEAMDFYFQVSDFIDTYYQMDEGYITYSGFQDSHFFLTEFCVNPAGRLKECLNQTRSAIFFSATLLPVNYYKELLAGTVEQDAIYIPSPFPQENRRILVARDVSSKYTRRNQQEYEKIAAYLRIMVQGKQGNYMAFFPSYAFLQEVAKCLEHEDFQVLAQNTYMSEQDREGFLEEFSEDRQESLLGLCVSGGSFSEGIDLTGQRLIGVAVIGTGIPQVCDQRQLIRDYYEKQKKNGFDFSYRYPGINKVMQAAGRLIRTVEDQGIILLLDERFAYTENLELFPKEWQDYQLVTLNQTPAIYQEFWEKT